MTLVYTPIEGCAEDVTDRITAGGAVLPVGRGAQHLPFR